MSIKKSKYTFINLLSFNSISVLLKIIMGLVSTKLSSIYLGISGINTLEFFRNFTSVAANFSQLGLQNGVIKNAAISQSKSHDRKLLSTAFTILMFFSVVVIITIILFRNLIQEFLFQTNVFEAILFVYLFTIPLIGLQVICINFIKGKQHYKTSIFIDIIGYSINILLSFYLIINYELIGAMLQIVFSPVLLFLFTYLFFLKKFKQFSLFSFQYFDWDIFKSLISFMLMGAFSSMVTPITFIVIRNFIQEILSIELAGIWSSILRLSSFYMMFVSSFIGLYFLPNIAKSTSITSLNEEARKYFKQFFPMVVLGLTVCYFLQNYIIQIVYTNEFILIKDYFYLQLIADAIRVLGIFWGYCILTKQLVKWYILFELFSVITYILSARFLINQYNLEGVYIAQILSLTLYLLVVFIFYKINLRSTYQRIV